MVLCLCIKGASRSLQAKLDHGCHCIRNSHAAWLNIATCAQQYFRKPLSFTTVCCCIEKCNLNICYSRRKLYINYMQWCRGFSGPELISDNQIIIFNLFLRKIDFEFSVPKTKGTIQTFISDTCKSKCLSWYIWVHQCKRHGWLAYV